MEEQENHNTEEKTTSKATPPKTKILATVAVFVILIIFGYILVKAGPTNDIEINDKTIKETPIENVQGQSVSNGEEVAKLKIEDLKLGTGDEAIAGKKITVNYLGTLTDGTKFDSSYDRNQPFSFDLGAGQVIEGWDKGFAGMKVGGKRRLTIPAEMGYGNQAVGTIPANSTLIFEVELLKVE